MKKIPENAELCKNRDQEALQIAYDYAVGAVLAQLEDLPFVVAVEVLRDALAGMREPAWFTLQDAENGGEEDYYRSKFPEYPHNGPWPQVCGDCEEFVNYDDQRGWFHVDPSAESCFLIGGN